MCYLPTWIEILYTIEDMVVVVDNVEIYTRQIPVKCPSHTLNVHHVYIYGCDFKHSGFVMDANLNLCLW